MFRQIFIFALFATCCGYCWADGFALQDHAPQQFAQPPVWPAPGSDADMQIATTAQDSGVRYAGDDRDNIRIVSKIGADLTVENNISMDARGNDGMGFSGGANLIHGYQAPIGFNIYENQAEMPLMHQAMLEDDGAQVLAMSRSGRKKPDTRPQMFLGSDAPFDECDECPDMEVEDTESSGSDSKIPDQVRSWVVASGSTLREVLQEWCNREGWDLVWGTSREYPIQASAVFKGRFIDVSSALVRNFSRANPVPYAKFYKGNRVLVVSTAIGE
ncbi:MAG: toxin co-regulated pilus biosynthesis Q family protein [Alphaproteobacteria bacterium]|nr:toxin co-regulated pilus biosynthesis Q family protein [Alphaproteobacteria bacterium]